MPRCMSQLSGEAPVLGNLGLGAQGPVRLRLLMSFPAVMDFRAPGGECLKFLDYLKKVLFLLRFAQSSCPMNGLVLSSGTAWVWGHYS